MSYYAIATVRLVGAEALIAAGFGFPAADTLVVFHVVGIGWLGMTMYDALFQFVLKTT
ncbi:hypothetical protein MTX26_29030 [Bradyrhizobium sp. ISRA443]|uniref:hypothetical protein n=1 Tax=unclassified Bradyrhizobium TaxID=2631580 RepID=UPI002478A744|nr:MULTISPECIES: hypothetical protein [unclassified Bradyrhizobium]WGR93685.1 hypothetical protein MTX20_03925 [Bradyrhizobium sp. ISRA435]WGR98261.1 hypothetical protein MTX23_29020 [Bradyrhizobium sp. ISRA436]WGS05149.1 hypothetical protein MTX18_29035 [Bradyrhizobium sp. ISRA437]WGS12035.1 hypothetical protein MTX26_29030 [Bradyrhizobium sp. ISRA443]